MINCCIANLNFTFCYVSKLMHHQLQKYITLEKGDIIISTEIVDKLDFPKEEAKYHSKYYDIYEINNEIIQVQRFEDGSFIGIIIYRINSATILLTKENLGQKEYVLSEYAFMYFILNKQDAILIHSSSFKYLDKGILLIASSGVGKSTHARLWKEHVGIEQINDDKNIIINENNTLYIYGNPWSGKYLIDENKKIKLTNFVFIHRSENNSVKNITKKEEFLLLIPHITNSSFMYSREKWNNMTNKLIEINGCNLNSNISYDAVDKLKEYLEAN